MPPGEKIALGVGLLLVLGGAAYGFTGGEKPLTVIALLIGASALSGWVRARQKRLTK